MAWTYSRKPNLPSDWDRRRHEVLVRANYTCAINSKNCITVATECDHIEHGDELGSGWPGSNLQAACRPCHAEKSAREGGAAWAAIRAKAKHPGERHPGMR